MSPARVPGDLGRRSLGDPAQQPASMLVVCGAGSGKDRRHPVFGVSQCPSLMPVSSIRSALWSGMPWALGKMRFSRLLCCACEKGSCRTRPWELLSYMHRTARVREGFAPLRGGPAAGTPAQRCQRGPSLSWSDVNSPRLAADAGCETRLGRSSMRCSAGA